MTRRSSPLTTRRKRTPSIDTNGDYWIDELGEVWKQVAFCAEPTASLENVKTGERVGGACSAPIFDRFTHLVKEPTS